jgi:ubiquinone/menaquinone biosynthesis C-methylase UbiE
MKDFERHEIDFEDAIAHRYDRDYFQPRIMRRHAEDFARFVAQRYRRRDRVLDLGCGPGSLYPLWVRYLPDPGCLIGIDISPRMVDTAKQQNPGGDFRVGSALEIPLEDESVDLVIASSVLHHLPDEVLVDALNEIRRVLTAHGTIVGREPVGTGRLADREGWLSGAIMGFHHLAARLTHAREYGEPPNGPHHHAYDPAVFQTHLTKVFAPKSIELRHPFSYYVGRCDHPLVERIAFWFDEWLHHHGGQEFYYQAVKNYVDAEDVRGWIDKALDEPPAYDRHQFMALLAEAAALLQRELGAPEDGHRGSPRP